MSSVTLQDALTPSTFQGLPLDQVQGLVQQVSPELFLNLGNLKDVLLALAHGPVKGAIKYVQHHPAQRPNTDAIAALGASLAATDARLQHIALLMVSDDMYTANTHHYPPTHYKSMAELPTVDLDDCGQGLPLAFTHGHRFRFLLDPQGFTSEVKMLYGNLPQWAFYLIPSSKW